MYRLLGIITSAIEHLQVLDESINICVEQTNLLLIILRLGGVCAKPFKSILFIVAWIILLSIYLFILYIYYISVL